MTVVGVGPTNVTLMQALWAKGGGQNALMRHGVAALLNAAHPGVDHLDTVQEVIDLVVVNWDNDPEWSKDYLESKNKLGCPF